MYICLIKMKHSNSSWALTINITHPPCVTAALSSMMGLRFPLVQTAHSSLSVSLKFRGDCGMYVEFTRYTNSPELYETLYLRKICAGNQIWQIKRGNSGKARCKTWLKPTLASSVCNSISANRRPTHMRRPKPKGKLTNGWIFWLAWGQPAEKKRHSG